MLRKSIKKFNWSRFAVAAGILLLTLILLFSLGIFDRFATAQNGPELEVSKSFSGQPLLGGNATVSITIENVGNERGFNLYLEDVFSSADPDLIPHSPFKTIDFISVSSSTGDALIYTVTKDPATGETTIRIDDIRDLEPTESITINIEVFLSDESWLVGDYLENEVIAEVNTLPNEAGDWIGNAADPAAASAEVIPITIVTKSANQSTGVEQATGTEDRVYEYTLDVQNNYINPTDKVVVVDTLPDGLEFLGVIDGGDEPFSVERNSATGETILTWYINKVDDEPGSMAAGENWTVTYEVGIRYDYYGTDNTGTNRDHDDSKIPPSFSANI